MNKKSKGKSLALTKLNCKIEDYSSEMLELVNAESKGELYTKFVEKFLTYIPVDYRSKDKICFFGDFTDRAFAFFKNKAKNERKIEVKKTTFNGSPSLTILVLTDNKPFIMDSLNCLLTEFGLKPLFAFHPVINCKRDAKGKLVDIVKKGEEGVRESLVFVKMVGTFENSTIERLESKINKIIDLVSYTYESWQTLLNKVIGITTDIVHHKDIYDEKDLHVEETLDFLNWLQKNNFTFLGMVDFDVKSKKITSEEGVKDIWADNLDEIKTIIDYSTTDEYKDRLEMLGKLNKISPVHRRSLIDYILIKQLDKNGSYKKGTIIFGLYGTAIYFQSIKSVPILRGKMNYVLDESDFPPNGYFAKKLKNIIESLPREILIQIAEDDLHCMCLHMLSAMRSRLFKLFIQEDWSNSFLNVIMFMPRERLTPDAYNKISKYMAEKFNCEVIYDNITVVAQDFSHLFMTLAISEDTDLDFSPEEVEKELITLTTDWSEAVCNKMAESMGEYEASLELREIEHAIPTNYRHRFNAEQTLEDLKYLRSASNLGKTIYNLIEVDKHLLYLKIYHNGTPLTLSDILPAIENLGFTAIDEQSFTIKPFKDVRQSWVYEFKLESPIEITDFPKLKCHVEEALDKMSSGMLTSDTLSKLIVMAGFDWTNVKLIKAISRYLHQTGFTYGKGYVQLTLVKHYQFTQMLVELFTLMFHPKKRSEQSVKEMDSRIADYLETVTSSAEDKSLRHMHLIVKAIVRTNFFQKTGGEVKEYISFKIKSEKVPEMPLPIPFAEIFVYSHEFEGIHLRGGKVARGGIRWSDRGEDYRTEVLGLMKSQMTKNTVIVPEGSKGTFFINLVQGDMSREDYMAKVVDCYKNFLRGLLDLTDNLFDGEVVHPANTVIYDDHNPYLVVAADKGTASFSDFANEVSAEYNFWLGDAFASGGSVGYDHKKMGITAKGAWISVQTHFLAMGIDVQKEPITVAGIGDMSGDVFGNGMLLSKQIKLVAAFNHMHIFLDPNPDLAKSYKERERLFKMPRSKWTDYNPKLMSKGGAIYDRSHKLLELTPEIQQLVGVSVDKITPDELIKAILKSRVDLIWNGGIGTYIKASVENDIEIGDKANDPLRVNACDVHARVIGEGGNLGISQLGRIEFALKGGRMNTDFIDNSAGVDCSDHEVNIKIALDHAVTAEKMDVEERNQLLEKMTDEVEDLVLQDNRIQNLAITINQLSKAFSIESFSQLIRDLEHEGLLDRKVEFLPDNTELSRRSLLKQNLTRPELSVLLSYSKMHVYKELNDASLTKDPYYEKWLLAYFPESMRKKFRQEIESHPLRTEILRTMITNKLVNQLGGPVINEIQSATGGEICDIARAHAIVCEIFDLDTLWDKVTKLPPSIEMNIRIHMYTELSKIMRRGISWFIRNVQHPIEIAPTIEEYRKQTGSVTGIVGHLLVGDKQTKYSDQKDKFIKSGIEEELAQSIAMLDLLVSAFDILYIAKTTGSKGDKVANLYFETGEMLNVDWLRVSCDSLIDESYWNRLSIQSLKDDLYDKQRRLIVDIIKITKGDFDLKNWLVKYESAANIFTNFVDSIKNQETININMLIIATKKFELFLRKLHKN